MLGSSHSLIERSNHSSRANCSSRVAHVPLHVARTDVSSEDKNVPFGGADLSYVTWIMEHLPEITNEVLMC